MALKNFTGYKYDQGSGGNKLELLGVKVDNLSKEKILERVRNFLNQEKFHQIATINPEFVLLVQKDSKFRKIINQCDLNIADGFGIKLACWRSGENLKSRIAGIDLMWEILKIANEKKYSVFLAANRNGLSNWQETRAAILKIYPDLEISGANLDENIVNYKSLNIDHDMLFCNFGAPYQEKFINSLKNGNIKLAMGVGGSFDFITGKIKRAPLWIRNIGMEWLWRLILQPKRFKRIFNSVIVFTWKIALNNKKSF